jgi:hypothetical protein
MSGQRISQAIANAILRAWIMGPAIVRYTRDADTKRQSQMRHKTTYFGLC